MRSSTIAVSPWLRFGKQLQDIRKAVDDLRTGMKVHSVTLNEVGQEAWLLAKPLVATVEERGAEDFTACFYDADVYGYGESIPEAIDDLKRHLVSQLEFLLEEAKRASLGPAPRRQLAVLKRLLREVPR